MNMPASTSPVGDVKIAAILSAISEDRDGLAGLIRQPRARRSICQLSGFEIL